MARRPDLPVSWDQTRTRHKLQYLRENTLYQPSVVAMAGVAGGGAAAWVDAAAVSVSGPEAERGWGECVESVRMGGRGRRPTNDPKKRRECFSLDKRRFYSEFSRARILLKKSKNISNLNFIGDEHVQVLYRLAQFSAEMAFLRLLWFSILMEIPTKSICPLQQLNHSRRPKRKKSVSWRKSVRPDIYPN